MSPRRALLSSSLLGACAAAGIYAFEARSRPAPPTAAAPVAPAAPSAPSAPRTAARGAEVFGLNEAVSIPRKLIELGHVPPEQEPTLLAADAAAAVAVGARMVRGPTQVYPYLDQLRLAREGADWVRADRWVRAVQESGLEPVMMVGPWPGNQTAGYTARYLPEDLEAYAAYVTRVVERYDGDGQDDMPGLLRGVHHWEVDNEPDLHNSRPPRDMPSSVAPEDFQTPAEYAQVLRVSADAIRAADPQARVLMAGLYSIRNEAGQRYARSLAQQPDFLASFDIANIHCYFDQDNLDAIDQSLTAIRQLAPGKPIWVTETSVPSDGEPPYQTEEWQGRMVAAIYGAFLAGGADRVFWHTLADPPPAAQARRTNPFNTNSLLKLPPAPPGGVPGAASGGPPTDKPAGAVYRRLAQLLAETSPADYREVPAQGGRLLDTGAGWLAFWGAPTLPEGAGQVTDLLTGETTDAKGSVTAPAYIGRAAGAGGG